MAQRTVGEVLAVVMALVFPLSMVAVDAHGALVYATNGVLVNGASIQRSAAVFSGDQVQVPSRSAVAITAPGNQIVLAAGSRLKYAAESVELDDSSGVAVTTSKGFAVKADKVTVEPAAGNTARYEVSRAGGEVSVTAVSGPVEVYDGTSTLTVAEGRTATVSDPAPQQTRPIPAGAPGLSAAMLLGIAAAVAAVGTIVVIETTKTPSPSRP